MWAADAGLGLSLLKAARRSKRVPAGLFDEAAAALADAAKGIAKSAEKSAAGSTAGVGAKEGAAAAEAFAKLAPLGALARFAEKEGSRAGLEVLARSEHLADIPRVIRAAEPFGVRNYA